MKDVINSAALRHSKDVYLGSDTRRRDEFATLLFAGYETTANTLAFVFHELVFHPEYQDAVLGEIRELLAAEGKKNYTEIEFKDLNRLKEVVKVIREAQRIWPAIPGGTSRVLHQEVSAPNTYTSRIPWLTSLLFAGNCGWVPRSRRNNSVLPFLRHSSLRELMARAPQI